MTKFLGKTIRIHGISQKGKNRVRENGDEWVVLAETDHVLFAPNQPGPWLFIAPQGQDQHGSGTRWVRAVGDQDFSITLV